MSATDYLANWNHFIKDSPMLSDKFKKNHEYLERHAYLLYKPHDAQWDNDALKFEYPKTLNAQIELAKEESKLIEKKFRWLPDMALKGYVDWKWYAAQVPKIKDRL